MSLLYILSACILWSLLPIVTKYLMQEQLFDPRILAFLRLLTGFLFLIILLIPKKITSDFSKLPKKDWLWVIIGGLGLGLNVTIFNLGLNHINAGASCLLEHVSTSMTMVILGCSVLNERFNLQRGAGLILCTAGLFLVTSNGEELNLLLKSSYFSGSLLVILSGVLWAGYGLSQKILSNKVRLLIGLTPILGISTLLSGALCNFQLGLSNMNFKAIGMILFLGIFCTAIPYGLLAKGFNKKSVGAVGIIIASIPVLTIIFAYILLGEILTKYVIFGGSLIILGIILDTV